MAVILETSLGDLTIDLYTEERPRCCKNFLKLCKIKYYNFCLFHSVQRNLMAQTGDPTDTGRGGESIYGKLYGDQAAYFEQEVKPRIKHKKRGLVSMVNNGSNMHGSQFFLTLGVDLDYLDGKHTVFGEVSEGEDILDKINEAYCDKEGRPFQDIRVFHTIVLDDPYDDPPGLQVPDRSPSPTKEQLDSGRIGVDEEIDDTKGLTNEEIEKMTRDREAKANAQLLEMVGDLPDAEMEAPDNVLFVCKLNPVTTSEDLEIIFSRFGNILSCEVIKDKKTEESLQYAFVEFEKPSDCESAYFKMDNVVIDDRRIHVDFSQSVSKVQWKGKGKGVVENEEKKDSKPSYALKNKSRQGQNYDLVYEEDEEDSSSEKKKKGKKKKQKRERSRSRSRDRKPTVSKERFREGRKGSRSPERGGKRYREDERSPKRDKYSRRSRSPQKDSSRHKVSKKRSPSPRDRSRSPKERSRRSRDRSRSPKERSRRSRDRSRSPKERSRRSRDRSRSPRDKSKGSRVRSRSPKERERYREKDRAGERGDRDRAERRKR